MFPVCWEERGGLEVATKVAGLRGEVGRGV